jgi:hypothetical protein
VVDVPAKSAIAIWRRAGPECSQSIALPGGMLVAALVKALQVEGEAEVVAQLLDIEADCRQRLLVVTVIVSPDQVLQRVQRGGDEPPRLTRLEHGP